MILKNKNTINSEIINNISSLSNSTPTYVYYENILKSRCNDLQNFIKILGVNAQIHYSTKANSNPNILKIINEAGISFDAMSEGEFLALEMAGVNLNKILFVANNLTEEDLKFVISKNLIPVLDSLDQVKLYGKLLLNGKFAVRFNLGIGAGHNSKTVTGGIGSKFGITEQDISELLDITHTYNLNLVGIHQHIGSGYDEPTKFIDGAKVLLEVANKYFNNLEFIDFGGGFGIPYKPDEKSINLEELALSFKPVLDEFLSTYSNKDVLFKFEPGRYIVAESSIIIGKVTSVKKNFEEIFVGTNVGFNYLIRPAMYESYHHISFIQANDELRNENIAITVSGNVCESGDILAKNRIVNILPEVGDFVVIEDTGAYGFSMCSNYIGKPKPAEVLVKEDNSIVLIRNKENIKNIFSEIII